MAKSSKKKNVSKTGSGKNGKQPNASVKDAENKSKVKTTQTEEFEFPLSDGTVLNAEVIKYKEEEKILFTDKTGVYGSFALTIAGAASTPNTVPVNKRQQIAIREIINTLRSKK